MAREFQGKLNAPSGRFAIVVARFHELITRRMLDGALETLMGRGVSRDNVDVAWVPGSFEIPVVARRLAGSGKYLAVLCLGAVIRGETPHNEYINREVAAGIQRAALETGRPVLFGVLTCDTMQQAIDRAGGKAGNKGTDVALAALEMTSLLEQLPR